MSDFPELKFTPENLERHEKQLRESGVFTTTRIRINGEIGDIFLVRGIGYVRLVDRKKYPEGLEGFEQMIKDKWKEEGFDSAYEFGYELLKIYRRVDIPYYTHTFKRARVRIEDPKDYTSGERDPWGSMWTPWGALGDS